MDAATVRKLSFDGYTLDPLNGRLTLEGAEIALRPKAFEVLCRLAEGAPNLVPKERLIDAVWPDVVVGDDSLVQCVREIRIALKDSEQKIVRTVPRRGYVFTRPVSLASDPQLEPSSQTPGAASPPAAVVNEHKPRRARWWVVGALAAGVVLAVAMLWRGVTGSPLDPWFARSTVPPPDALTIAVLPLRNLSADADQDYLVEALTADLTTDLSRLPKSMVTARASAARYRDKGVDTRRVGEELGVTYLIEGSVRRLDDEVRLNVQLIEANTGKELWAASFDERRDHLADLQRQVTAGLSRTLHVRLFDAESRRRLDEHAGHPQANDLTLRGWYLWQQNRPDTVAQAREMLLQAVQLDPTAAYAWACLNFTYISDLTNNWIDLRQRHTWAEWLQRADEAATRAYELDPNLPAAMGARSATLMLQGRIDESIALREKQIALSPSDPIARHNLAALKLFAGHPDQVLEQEQAAMRVSPHDPKLHQMMGIVALSELHLHHDAQALQWAEHAVAVNPDYVAGQGLVASAAAHLGNMARARTALADLRRLRPTYRIQTFRDEFDRYSANSDFRSGQERYYDGLRLAGL
jgi:TolB-like protein/DNA-binding winged helix-turn-helix (wHTH) protein